MQFADVHFSHSFSPVDMSILEGGGVKFQGGGEGTGSVQELICQGGLYLRETVTFNSFSTFGRDETSIVL